MQLKQVVKQNRTRFAEQWFQATINTYPAQTAKILAKDADRFAKWDGSGNRADEYLRCGLHASHVLYDIARNIMKVKEGEVQNEDEVKFLRQLIQVDEGAKSFAQNIVGIQYALCAIRK